MNLLLSIASGNQNKTYTILVSKTKVPFAMPIHWRKCFSTSNNLETKCTNLNGGKKKMKKRIFFINWKKYFTIFNIYMLVNISIQYFSKLSKIIKENKLIWKYKWMLMNSEIFCWKDWKNWHLNHQIKQRVLSKKYFMVDNK